MELAQESPLQLDVVHGNKGSLCFTSPMHSLVMANQFAEYEAIVEKKNLGIFQCQPKSIGFLPANQDFLAINKQHYNYTIVRISDRYLKSFSFETIDPNKLALRYTRAIKSEVTENLIDAFKTFHQKKNQKELSMLFEHFGSILAKQVISLQASHLFEKDPYPKGIPEIKLRRVLEYIENNLSSPMQLSKLADIAAMSHYHFARAFKKSIGVTPVRYVWARRVDRAKIMLKNKDFALADITAKCGFSSQSHFTTLFRKITGTTPGIYRRDITGKLDNEKTTPWI